MRDIQALIEELSATVEISHGEVVVCHAEAARLPEVISKLRDHKADILALMHQRAVYRLGPPAITPAMLPLAELTQEQIDLVTSRTPGGSANVQDVYPLAPLQDGILFHHLMAERGDPYLLWSLLSFTDRGRLDAYAAALNQVIARHDILRTAFLWEDLPEPVQVVRRRASLPVEEVVLDPADGDVGEQLRARFDPRDHRIDLRAAPLLRLHTAYDPVNDRWLAMQLMHHLIGDHTTVEGLRAEVEAHLAGRGGTLGPATPFRDFVARTRDQDRAGHETFFRRMLSSVSEPTSAFGMTDVLGDGSDVGEARREVDLDLARQLRRQARALRVSTASLCHLAWGLVAARAAGRDEVVFGTVLFGRMDGGAGSDSGMGLFINTLPLRIELAGRGVEEGVREAHARLAELLEHEHASLALAQACSGAPAGAALFTSLLNYRYAQTESPSLEGSAAWEGISLLGADERTNYPLTLSVDDLGEGLALTAQARGSARADLVCEMMHQALARLSEALERAPQTPLSALDVLPAAERAQLVEGWNATETAYPDQALVHELFEAWAAATPAATAVSCADQTLSYEALNARANRLARRLRELGVGPDTRVAICMERSIELVVALLAVLKAGGAYVPLDPSYPVERLGYMLADAGPVAILSHGPALAVLDGLTDNMATLDLDEDQAWVGLDGADLDRAGLTPENLAYVIYTSGSTGQPKGVMVEHRGVMNRIWWMHQAYGLAPAVDAVLQKTPFSFDVSVWEFLWPLMAGVRLVMAKPEGHKDPAYLKKIIDRERITTLHFVPSMLSTFLDDPNQGGEGVTAVFCSGEALPSALACRFQDRYPHARLHNLYGPTEASIDVTAWTYPTGHAGPIPIGRPIANTRIYILDGAGEPVPAGVTGELYIGGAGVARGYLNRPELTAERFVQSPFVAGDRLYRTGDLGRYRPDGTIQFLGRNDFQVKIRGFRIELGEVEAQLAACAGVREAVVLAREDQPGDKRLVAYYTSEAAEGPDPAALRAQLAERLPEYMTPSAYVRLETLPLTPNGKLDRAGLPAPGAEASAGYEAPQGALEETLAEIWAQVLGLERVGRGDNFFELGGHSLLAVKMVFRVRQDLGVEITVPQLYDYPTLGGFAAGLSLAGPASAPLLPTDRGQAPPLSFAQERLWFLSQMDGVSAAYHVPLALRLKGPLEAHALEGALERLVARHEALRTRFVTQEGQARQEIDPPGRFVLERQTLEAGQTLEAQLASEALEPFDLACGPLIRGRLIALAPQEHVLLVTMHHIVSDGWSMAIFIRELGALYGELTGGPPAALPALAVQYADYAAWQRAWLSGEVLVEQSRYWSEALEGAPALLALPTDRPRPAEQDFSGAFLPLSLDAGLTERLKAVSQRHGTTLFMTVLAAYGVVLSRLSGQQDLVIGTPSANRTRAETEGLIGFFVNTLALRLRMEAGTGLGALLAQVKAVTLGAQANQDLPFEQVVELVQPARSLSHTPLFQVMFAWENNDIPDLALAGLEIEAAEMAYPIAKFDLTLNLGEAGGRIQGGIEYATALFDEANVARIGTMLERVLTALAQDQDQAVSAVKLLDAAERAQLVEGWNATETAYPDQALVHELFEAWAAATPAATAVSCADQTLSYEALNARANRLARRLRELGVGPDTRVAICMERSIELVVALLAVLKAGGAYVPLDPSYPVERLGYMLADAGPVAILSHGPALAALATAQALAEAAATPVLDLDQTRLWEEGEAHDLPAAEIGLTARHLAYVIYTSGSTGQPKGVMVEHRGVVNLALAQATAFGVAADSRILQFASFSFDAAVSEVMIALCHGAMLGLEAARERLVGETLEAALERLGATHVTLPPPALATLTQVPGSLETVILAGEAPPPGLVEAWSQRLTVFNAYGPTETTVCATAHRCSAADVAGPIPIGRPIANTRIYILDGAGEPVPAGVTGELYIGGAGVARGYLNRPELTAERFVQSPFVAGDRLYRTGDLGRYRPDGTIQFLGRNDFQVKIRGFRIELGEVEAQLAACAGVREAVVLAREDQPGDKRLVAYYTSEAAEGPDPAALRAQLAERLPEYMTPSAYVRLETLPLTPNGKLDRAGLPAPGAEASAGYEAPQGALEETLAEIWAQVLGLERVGRGDNFFELGGHSLLATKVVHLSNLAQLQLNMRDIFMAGTLANLALAAQTRTLATEIWGEI